MRGPKVIIVSENVDPHSNSTSYYWGNIVNDLSYKFGKIAVVSASVRPEALQDKENILYLQCKSVRYNKNSLFSRAFGQTLISMRMAYALLKAANRGDIIFSGTNPTPMVFLVAIIKICLGLRWALLVHDVFPENAVAAKIVKGNSFFYKTIKALADFTYGKADVLIAIGRDMKKLLAEKTRQNPQKIAYIPNWVGKHDITPLRRFESSSFTSSFFDGKIVFQFFGNMGRVQGLSDVMRAIRLVKSENAIFLFIGAGAAEDEIRAFAKTSHANNIYFSPAIDFINNNSGLSACDIAIVSLASGMNGLGVPSKTYFSLAAGKPILALTDPGSEIYHLINEEDIGWFCPITDHKAISKTIESICESDFSIKSKNARIVAESKYDKSLSINRYAQALQSLIENGIEQK